MPKPIAVQDYMTANIVTLRPDMSVLDAIHELVEHRISGAPVIDDGGELVGMLSERDCLALTLSAGYHGEGGGRVADYMSTGVVTVNAQMSIVDLAMRFLKHPYRRYPVLKQNRLVGIISRRDVLRGLLERD